MGGCRRAAGGGGVEQTCAVRGPRKSAWDNVLKKTTGMIENFNFSKLRCENYNKATGSSIHGKRNKV